MGWTLVILAETWRPVPPILPVGADVTSHFLGFLVLGVFAIMTARCWQVPDGPWIAALGCMFFGTIDEAGQVWVPGRAVDWWDWAADLSGAFVGIAAILALYALLNRRHRTGV